MNIDYFSMVLNAICTGIGLSIGLPVGQWIYDKIKEHRKKIGGHSRKIGDPKNIDLAWDALGGKK